MKNGKVLTLFTTVYTSLMESWKNLYSELKAYEASRIQYEQLQKVERLDWEYWDGILISRKKDYLSRGFYLSLKLGRFLVRLKLKVKELLEILLKYTVNLCGVLVLVCVILISALSLPLLVIRSLAGMFRRVLNLGPLMYLRNKVRKVLSLEKTQR